MSPIINPVKQNILQYGYSLVEAIQNADVMQVSSIIEEMHKNMEPVTFLRSINHLLPNCKNLTAFHIAAKGYQVYRFDAIKSKIYNEICQILLDHSASPYIEIGTVYDISLINGKRTFYVKKKGRTILEECNGVCCPALLEQINKRELPTDIEHSQTMLRIKRKPRFTLKNKIFRQKVSAAVA